MHKKMQIKKFLNLSTVLDIDNYCQSLQKWFQFRKKFQHITNDMTEQAFDDYLNIIKPVIHHFSQLTTNLSPEKYGFFTKLKKNQIIRMQDLYKPLQKFSICPYQKQMIKAQHSEIEKYIQQKKQLIYRLNLAQPPKNLQWDYWNNTIKVKQIVVTSKVVRGKGVGAKQLGMPTANLLVTQQIQKQLLCFPNGIYVSLCKIDDKTYTAVASIGTNPHYENFQNSRCIEAYIIHDFEEMKFYDVSVTLKFLRIIRLEGKFYSFDAFLNAMHNDIYVGKLFSI